MKIVRLSIDRPVTTLMFYVAVILLGFISLRQLSVDLLPNISYPRLSVMTQYPGVAPEEIETLVSMPLEAAVSRVPGLRRVESVSKEGRLLPDARIRLGDGHGLHHAPYPRGARQRPRRLPSGAENPTIIPMDPQSKPILVLAVSGEADLLDLKDFAEELVKPRLEQIEGIGSAEITGGVEREIQVEINPQLLALYGLTIDDVAGPRSTPSTATSRAGRSARACSSTPSASSASTSRSRRSARSASRRPRSEGVVRLKDVARGQGRHQGAAGDDPARPEGEHRHPGPQGGFGQHRQGHASSPRT